MKRPIASAPWPDSMWLLATGCKTPLRRPPPLSCQSPRPTDRCWRTRPPRHKIAPRLLPVLAAGRLVFKLLVTSSLKTCPQSQLVQGPNTIRCSQTRPDYSECHLVTNPTAVASALYLVSKTRHLDDIDYAHASSSGSRCASYSF
jgi:hypothetical protein